MNFKIDTKEKFTIITPMMDLLSDNLTAELIQHATNCFTAGVKNVVLNMKNVKELGENAGKKIAELQQSFYDQNTSFVICEINSLVEKQLDQSGLLEDMNTTPSESEAWDIVQMEEIERELLDDTDPEFGK